MINAHCNVFGGRGLSGIHKLCTTMCYSRVVYSMYAQEVLSNFHRTFMHENGQVFLDLKHIDLELGLLCNVHIGQGFPFLYILSDLRNQFLSVLKVFFL